MVTLVRVTWSWATISAESDEYPANDQCNLPARPESLSRWKMPKPDHGFAGNDLSVFSSGLQHQQVVLFPSSSCLSPPPSSPQQQQQQPRSAALWWLAAAECRGTQDPARGDACIIAGKTFDSHGRLSWVHSNCGCDRSDSQQLVAKNNPQD